MPVLARNNPAQEKTLTDYTAGKAWKIEREDHIMEEAFCLFSAKGIIPVTIPDVAKASGVGRATVYRYFPAKMDLVIAVAVRKWEEYIDYHNGLLSEEAFADMSGAEYLKFIMDSFIDLYRNHKDILRFNYDFNNYLRYEPGTAEQKQPYMDMMEGLVEMYKTALKLGRKDGTIRTDVSPRMIFSATFHIMLAAVTRYAVGLVYLHEEAEDPESELIMLEELLLSRFTA